MTIRKYREADRQALIEITAEAFRGVSIDHNIERQFGEVAHMGWRERKARAIEEDIRAHAGGIFVAEEDGRVVGYVTTRLDRQGKVGHIPNIAVEKGRRSKGIGRKLLEHGLSHFRERGMELARIETLTQNEVGVDFYPRLGFVEIARQVHFAMRL